MLINNKKKKIVSLLIIILVVSLAIGGYSLAKYVSQIRGSVLADIASWSFKVNGDTQQMKSINIFDTCEKYKMTNGKIAPGTEGKFKIKIDASGSDVNLEYKFEFKENGIRPENFKFIYDNKQFTNLNDIKQYIDGIIKSEESYKIREIEIGWIWQYETGNSIEEIRKADNKDTQDGIAFSQYNIDITVTGAQINI